MKMETRLEFLLVHLKLAISEMEGILRLSDGAYTRELHARAAKIKSDLNETFDALTDDMRALAKGKLLDGNHSL